MLRAWAADLHVHTFLSPCASRDMSPGAVVRRCREVGLDVVAITDHNSGGNVARAMAEAASGPTPGPVVIAGGLQLMEDAAGKADARGMPVLSTELPAFEAVGRLYQLGVRGEV